MAAKRKGDTRARFTDEVKAKAVAMWRNPNRTESMTSIAQSFGTSQQSVRQWVDAADKRDRAAKRQAANGKTYSEPEPPKADPVVRELRQHMKPKRGLLELTNELQTHMAAIKAIKAELRKLLEE